jgi:hypothetical protein
MKRMIFVFLALLAICSTLPYAASASRPVPRTLEGCVIKGVFYSVSQYKGETRVNRIDCRTDDLDHPISMSRYEGKKIKVSGLLSPGDVFVPDLKTLKVLSPCDRNTKKAITESSQ